MSKRIWECSITVHMSIREDTNSVLLSLAKDRRIKKTKIIQDLIVDHPDFIKKFKAMEEEGYFI